MESFVYKFISTQADRADRILRNIEVKQFCWISRASWNWLFDEGRVLKTKPRKEKISQGSVLSVNDEIEIHFPMSELSFSLTGEQNINLVYLDPQKNYAIFSKPVHMPSYPHFFWENNTFINAAAAYLEKEKIMASEDFLALSEAPILEAGLVQRLDTDTSGLLLVALNKSYKNVFRRLFSEQQVSKKYLAIVHGVAADRMNISMRLDLKNSKKVVKSKIKDTGEEVSLTYRTLKKNSLYSLLEVETKDGVRHIVRAVLAELGLPLLGDSSYSNKTETVGFHQLHAYELKIEIDGAGREFFCFPPNNFMQSLNSVGLSYEFKR